jgi:hypothetical protein
MSLEKLAACPRALLPVSRGTGTGALFKRTINTRTYTLRLVLYNETADLEHDILRENTTK